MTRHKSFLIGFFSSKVQIDFEIYKSRLPDGEKDIIRKSIDSWIQLDVIRK